MRLAATCIALGAVVATLSVTPARAQSPVYIEYTVTGSATASGRDADVVLCSVSEGQLTIHTMGSWVFDVEGTTAAPGAHDATLRVAAPASVAALHDTNIRTDDHLSGPAKLVISSAGQGQANIPLIRVRFTADSLSSETGAHVKAAGTLVCPVM